MTAPETPEPQWRGRSLALRLEPLDRVSLGILGALTLLLLLGRDGFVPIPPDGYYHMTVARRIIEAGRIPLWDWWQFAPIGRPHLYPPLFHLIIAACSLPWRGDVFEGFRVVQALTLPVSLLGTWYLARWLFDARRAFVVLLLAGMDCLVVMMALLGVPSLWAGALACVLLAAFLSQRYGTATLLLAITLYLHSGVACMVCVGLLLFSLWQRDYLKGYLLMIASGAALAAPWYYRYWVYRDWLSHPIDQNIYGHFSGWHKVFIKLSWLQLLNLVLVVLVLRAIPKVPWRELRSRLLLTQILGFLPMLVNYGGRYAAHTLPYWVALAALPFVRYLAPPVHRRRVALFLVLALTPGLVAVGFGTVLPMGVYPMVSGWMLPPAVAFGARRLFDDGAALGLVSTGEARAIGEYIQSVSTPDQIIHLNGDRDLGVMVGFFADRSIDLGAWEEVSPPPEQRAELRRRSQADTGGIVVSRQVGKRTLIWRSIGRYYIGMPGREPAPE